MQARKNNLEIQLMSLFGHYFSVLKRERQPDDVVFQPKADREESSLTSGSGLGSLPRHCCGPSLALPGAARSRPGGAHGAVPGQLPSEPLPLISSLTAQNISAALVICGETGEPVLTHPHGPSISPKAVSKFPCHTSPQITSDPNSFKKNMLKKVYLSCSGFSCRQAEISSWTNV